MEISFERTKIMKCCIWNQASNEQLLLKHNLLINGNYFYSYSAISSRDSITKPQIINLLGFIETEENTDITKDHVGI